MATIAVLRRVLRRASRPLHAAYSLIAAASRS